jgi:peptide/nickel transport system substrate-binding protein
MRSLSGTRRSLVLTLGVVATLSLGACGGPTPTAAPTSAPTAGGTIYILNAAELFDQVDPQRVYTPEDLAFFSGTIYRSLTAYSFSPDPTEGTSLTPDLATDLGTATDGGKTWAFTLRDGMTFQDGSPITCADVAYGASRTFATDVISGGPKYAIAYLDIPTDPDGSSSYKGPYKQTGQALFDKAVTCSPDNKTVTFHLNKPVADFDYTVTLGFSPVPKAADTGETYGSTTVLPVSSGPYKVDSYTTGYGGKMLLSRNPNWNQASDPYRTPYPDRWEVDFGIDPKVLDQRIMQSSGKDQYAIQYGQVQPEDLAAIFTDPQTTTAAFTGRAISGFDPFVLYYWIDVNKVKNPKIRQAMAVALDRKAIRTNIGGAFAGTYADGVIKPSLRADYAPTGMWDTLLGQKIPDTGDPAYAKQLIAQSGEAAPTLVSNFGNTPVGQKTAAIVISSLAKAGIAVKLAPLETAKGGDFGPVGWGADWPNASDVIPPLFTVKGGFDLSRVDDPAFNAKVDAALNQLDRTKQATMWQALNKEAMQNVWVIPTFFGLSQTIAGTKIGGIYRWAAYGSWPYGAMYVKP